MYGANKWKWEKNERFGYKRAEIRIPKYLPFNRLIRRILMYIYTYLGSLQVLEKKLMAFGKIFMSKIRGIDHLETEYH